MLYESSGAHALECTEVGTIRRCSFCKNTCFSTGLTLDEEQQQEEIITIINLKLFAKRMNESKFIYGAYKLPRKTLRVNSQRQIHTVHTCRFSQALTKI